MKVSHISLIACSSIFVVGCSSAPPIIAYFEENEEFIIIRAMI